MTRVLCESCGQWWHFDESIVGAAEPDICTKCTAVRLDGLEYQLDDLYTRHGEWCVVDCETNANAKAIHDWASRLTGAVKDADLSRDDRVSLSNLIAEMPELA